MRKILPLALLAALPAATVLAQQQAYKPGPHNVTFPAEYRTKFIRYATVDKPDRKIVRYLYVNPETFAAAKKAEPLPDGTVIVMEDHAARLDSGGAPLLDQQGRFMPQPAATNVFIQEKRAGWGAGYADTVRNGEWEYARFNADGSRNPASVEACFACHKRSRAAQDFVFNFWDYLQARR